MTTKPALTYLSLGCGVQSSTIAEMVTTGHLPPPDLAIFSDLHDEPAHVYQQLAYLTERLATRQVPVIVLNQPSIVETLLSSTNYTSIPLFIKEPDAPRPGRLRRQCTNQFKAEPIEAYIKSLLNQRGLTRKRRMKTTIADVVKTGVTIECWLGISLDEVHRMKPNRTPWITNRWPLIDFHMSRTACIQWLTNNNLPIPSKSNCRICPYHRTDDWRAMATTRPADFAHVCHIEDQLRAGIGRFAAGLKGEITLSHTGIPLRDLITQLETTSEPSLFDICDEGYCWV